MNLRHKNHTSLFMQVPNHSLFSFIELGTRGVASHPFPPRNEFPLLRPNRHVPGCFLRPCAPGAIAHSAKIALHCASWRRYATACSSNFGHWTSLDMWPEPRVHKVSRNSGCLHIRRAKGVCSWLLRRRDWTDVDGVWRRTLDGISFYFLIFQIRRKIYRWSKDLRGKLLSTFRSWKYLFLEFVWIFWKNFKNERISYSLFSSA